MANLDKLSECQFQPDIFVDLTNGQDRECDRMAKEKVSNHHDIMYRYFRSHYKLKKVDEFASTFPGYSGSLEELMSFFQHKDVDGYFRVKLSEVTAVEDTEEEDPEIKAIVDLGMPPLDTFVEWVRSKPDFKGLFDDLAHDIRFQRDVVAYIVAQLEKYDFLHSSVDVKGMAYETIVGPTLEGTRGEFFTPRNLVKMAVKMLDPKPGDRILDPACGTGGFLVVAFNYISEKLRLEAKEAWKDPDKPTEKEEESLKQEVREAGKSIFGIDFNSNLVKTAQMNMIMNNDGRGGFYSVNSLWKTSSWPKEVSAEVSLAGFDIVMTNPPFGTKIKVERGEILEQFDLAHAWVKENNRWIMQGSIKTGVPPEILFIERCFQFLKPGTGRMGIVLPDGILGNPDLEYVRYWIMSHCQVLASVDLPVEMFLPRTGTQTSMLFLRRKSDQEKLAESLSGKPADYSIFMAVAKKVGKDRRGNIIYKRDKEGREVICRDLYEAYANSTVIDFPPIVETTGRVIDDDLPEKARLFAEKYKDR
jgi:type I restriction enzyme M protein